MLDQVVGDRAAILAIRGSFGPIDAIVLVAVVNAVVVNVAAGDRVAAAFLIEPRVIIALADFDVVEDHVARSRRIHDTNPIENVAFRTLED